MLCCKQKIYKSFLPTGISTVGLYENMQIIPTNIYIYIYIYIYIIRRNNSLINKRTLKLQHIKHSQSKNGNK